MAIGGEFTRRLLRDAGIKPGMRVFDAGCGSGDVSFIAAELVGSAGRILGIDRSEAAVATARERAAASGPANVSFEVRDIDDPPPVPFDAVVGRRVLMYHPEPERAVRALASVLGPGGILAFHEHTAVDPAANEGLPLHRRAQGWLHETVRQEGGSTRMGLDLHAILTRAGLSVREVRAEAIVQTPTQPYPLASIASSILNRILECGVATAGEIGIESLAARLDEERLASGSTHVLDMMFGAWARKDG